MPKIVSLQKRTKENIKTSLGLFDTPFIVRRLPPSFEEQRQMVKDLRKQMHATFGEDASIIVIKHDSFVNADDAYIECYLAE